MALAQHDMLLKRWRHYGLHLPCCSLSSLRRSNRRLSTSSPSRAAAALSSFRVNPDHRRASIAFAGWLQQNGLRGTSASSTDSPSSSSSAPPAPRPLSFGIKQSKHNNWSLIATVPLQQDDTILTLPLSLTLAAHDTAPLPQPQHALAPLSSILSHVPDSLWQLQLGLRLLSERTKAVSSSGSVSFFQPYIDLLPVSYPGIPLFFSAADLDALQYAPLQQQVLKRSRLLASLVAVIAQQQAEDRQNDPFHGVSVDVNALGWAMSAASSRAFSFQSHHRLLPLIDLCNHSFAPSARLSFADGLLRLQTTRPLQSGDELTLDYGGVSNDAFLIDKGFVVDDNPHDDLSLRFDIANIQLALDLTQPSAPPSPPLPASDPLLASVSTSDLLITRSSIDPRVRSVLVLLLCHPSPPLPFHELDALQQARVRKAESVFLGLVAGAMGGGGGGLEADLRELKQESETEGGGREQRLLALRYRIAKKRLLREHINRIEREMKGAEAAVQS